VNSDAREELILCNLEYLHVVEFLPENKEIIEQEFLLGDKILVAPIVERRKTERVVFIGIYSTR